MSSVLGYPILRGYMTEMAAADSAVGGDTDTAAETAVSADAVTTVAASAYDQDDALHCRCLLRAHYLPPCSRHIRSHARPAEHLP